MNDRIPTSEETVAQVVAAIRDSYAQRIANAATITEARTLREQRDKLIAYVS